MLLLNEVAILPQKSVYLRLGGRPQNRCLTHNFWMFSRTITPLTFPSSYAGYRFQWQHGH